MAENERIIQINIEEEMKSAYIDYSMSVIVSRALPDVRDGMKPVHRRVLYGMTELGLASNKPYKKSARIVGEVLGKFHPHGDSSVYFAMVRMAQPWSLRYPLVEGQGNFGSIDDDPPAAMRYTEARLEKIAEDMLIDIEKNTVDFQNNFDDSLTEPTVLPTRIPNLLINGASGIAVGMATNMPPHNLSEVCDGVIAYINNKDITAEELIEYIKAPDFPTGGIIYGYQGVKDALLTGRGRVVVRGKVEVETDNNREKIIITEIPYQVVKSNLIKAIADLVNDKKLDGISNINDESDRSGMRIVIDLKRDAIANVVINHLYKQTALQSSFSVNNICLVKGRPQMLNIQGLIKYFVEHRLDVILRRTKYELEQAEKRAHILEGLIIASDNIDEVIAIIKAANSPDTAKTNLIERFNLSDLQANAIVEMRLRQLTGLEQSKLRDEFARICLEIERLKAILASEELQMEIIKNETLEVKAKYGDKRRTEIVYSSEEFNPEDFYADEEMIITISHLGYIKRTSLSEFKTQNRGGVGSKGSTTRDEDFIEHIYPATMHNTMLFFTKLGKCFWLKVYEIPEGSKTSKGRAIQNLLNIDPSDQVNAFIRVKQLNDKEYLQSHYIIMGTKDGIIKKSSLEDYSRRRQNGVNAITIKENDELLQARLTNGSHEILMATKSGRAIRFNESAVRCIGRTGAGVKGITIDRTKDEVIGFITVKDDSEDILVVSQKGYGKRSSLEDYRVTNRGGKGVKTMNLSEKTGSLIAIRNVSDDNDLMIINKSGIVIRLACSDIRTLGRATMGVRLINLDKKQDEIASIAKVLAESKEEELIDGEHPSELSDEEVNED